ncbi:MAG: aspartate aminotransferase family protein [Sphingorhabdus sp.]|jgi:glutamate-1-semialdehyde 2,1-aminomutase|uniref:aspartate aminotransferase family protein n=1 Tax=Sphingorhabdus sp. TaxID=1902408 RepID=UPI00273DEE18|nr:aspartate aminotransferase family protein [Sphingorhabdus sp.]MDP4873499.1 aspartate aminotransferase family protein [Sphingorhabdus sp.]MDP4926429.1 aspartate aminotransferase family protein [Sphingorhabdus sp.]
MINRQAIHQMREREIARFIAANPKSKAHAKSVQGWFQGVPFHWMLDWSSPFPIVAQEASGATLTSIDGQVFDDFCLGDTASMFGHSPAPLAKAIAAQAGQGLSYMLPTAKGAELGSMLADMFGLPQWQVTTTASEANRAVIRWCRGITGRDKILIFNGCYHGAVDDVFVDLRDGRAVNRPSLIGQVQDLLPTTVAIEFNDVDALASALRGGDIACVLAEPLMTNIGMVRDTPGFLTELRRLCDETSTILVFDETHTISSGYGGHSNMHGPKPDILVVGKSIGGGVPCAVYGFTEAIAKRMAALNASRPAGHSGIGTTLSANAMAITAMHAMLGQVITRDAYAHMLSMADRLVAQLNGVISTHALDWHVSHVGARVELVCSAIPPRNGSEARAVMDHALESTIHLYLVNRGILLAPFHNMMLVSPVTQAAQVDRLAAELNSALTELLA